MLTAFVMIFYFGCDFLFISYLFLSKPSMSGFIALMLVLLFHLFNSIVLSRVIQFLYPLQVGKFSTKSSEYDRWRAQGVIAISSSVFFDIFIPLWAKPMWFRLFGAKLSSNVIIGGRIIDPLLVTMEENSGLGLEGIILGHHIANNHIVIGEVFIRKNVMVGARSLVMPNVDIKKGATVGACSLVTSGKVINEEETWVGIPAKKLNIGLK
jgi:hypothetical protein